MIVGEWLRSNSLFFSMNATFGKKAIAVLLYCLLISEFALFLNDKSGAAYQIILLLAFHCPVVFIGWPGRFAFILFVFVLIFVSYFVDLNVAKKIREIEDIFVILFFLYIACSLIVR